MKMSEGCMGLGISVWKKVRTSAGLLIDGWRGPNPGASLAYRLSPRPRRFQPAWGEIFPKASTWKAPSGFALLASLILCTVGFGSPAAAQSQTGLPAFGSRINLGPAVVNLSNLNVHVSANIFSKPGRGLPLNYSFMYDSLGAPSFTGMGWTRTGPAGWIEVSNTYAAHCPNGQGPYNVYSFGTYYDANGTTHSFPGASGLLGGATLPGTSVFVVGPSNVPCVLHAGDSGAMNDGTGWRYVVDQFLDVNFQLPDGTLIQPIHTKYNGPNTLDTSVGGSIITDRNGNMLFQELSPNPNQIVDTTGTTFAVGGDYLAPTSLGYTDSNGRAQTVNISYGSGNVQTNYGCTGGITDFPATALGSQLVTQITYPDGSAEKFSYEPTPGYPTSTTGRIASITLRTGGTISFTYPGPNDGINCADGSLAGLTVTLEGGTWNFQRSSSASTTTITDPQGNQTVVTFGGGLETQRQVYQGDTKTGTLLNTVTTCYNGNKTNCATSLGLFPITELTVFRQVNGKENELDTFFDGNSEVPTEVDEYDFGSGQPGVLLRKRLFTYRNLGNNILNRPASVTVCAPGGTDSDCNSSGTKVAQTTYTYDGTAPTATSNITQHVSVSGARGNLTSIQRWLNTTGGIPPTTNTFDDTGNILTTTDPGGHQTSFTYGACNGAFPAQTKFPDTNSPHLAHHTTSATYDCNTGLVTTATDQNNGVTRFFYDNIERPTEIDSPDGGQTLTSYPDLNHTTVTRKIDSSRTTSYTTVVDGYGRVSRTAVANGESTPYDQQDSCYDSNGRLSFRSYLFQGNAPNSAATCPPSLTGDTFAYDAIGRPTTVTHSDGTSASTSYTGLATQVTDEGNGTSTVSRILQRDGLGRLASVCELYSGSALLGNGGTPAGCGLDISGTGFLTSYGYDTLGNLTSVSQGALTNRTYSYDSLSRLTSETTPEAGAASFTYNADSLLSTRVRPAPNQTSSTTTTTTNYAYDALHRLVGRSFTNDPSSTPAATFNYDETSVWGTSLANTVGRLTSESVGSPLIAEQIFSYDPAGRVSLNAQCTPNTCNASPIKPYSLGYQYDLLGDPTSAGNGVGITFTDSYNIAGRLTGVTSSLSDANHPATLLSNVSYSPTRITDTLGNGVVESTNFSPRGLLTSYLGDAPGGQPGTGGVAITGALQTYQQQTQAATAATGSVTINSSTGEQCDRDPAVCQTGSVSISFNNGAETDSASYGSGDTPSTVAANLAKAINNCGHSPCYATATSSGATVTFTSTATGSGANWPVATSYNAPAPSAFWATGTVQTPNSKTGAPGCLGSMLSAGQVLYTGQCLNSPNGRFVLALQTDGNLVLYDDTPDPNPWTALWSTGTSGRGVDHGYMQSQGNFVLYAGSTAAVWSSPYSSVSAYYLVVQDDGNLVIYSGFPQPSFSITPSQQTMSGGKDAAYQTAYDNGSTAISVNNHSDSYPWSGSGTTAGSIAQGLCNAINGDTGAFVTASTNGTPGQCPRGSATVRLVSKQSGQNYSLTASSSSVVNSFSAGCPGFADCTSASLSGAGNPAYSFSLGRAPDGQITSANDFVNGNWIFGYDPFNRLASSNNNGQQSFTYEYDRYANRWHQNAPQGGPAPQYTFDNNNHFVGSGVTYDALGEILTDGLGNSFTWDAEGRLIQVNQGSTVTATYSYDAEGFRVHGPNGEYLYDLDGNMITQFGLNGSWSFGEIYAGARHLATYSGGTTNFFHPDWLGTKRVITTLNGTTAQTCTGFAFGDGVNCTGNNVTFNGFTDDIHDPETNLEHTLFRKYSSTQGRWLTPDPAGAASAAPTNPQSWNRYAYVLNDPVNATDPLGLEGFSSGDIGGFGLCGFGSIGCGFSPFGPGSGMGGFGPCGFGFGFSSIGCGFSPFGDCGPGSVSCNGFPNFGALGIHPPSVAPLNGPFIGGLSGFGTNGDGYGYGYDKYGCPLPGAAGPPSPTCEEIGRRIMEILAQMHDDFLKGKTPPFVKIPPRDVCHDMAPGGVDRYCDTGEPVCQICSLDRALDDAPGPRIEHDSEDSRGGAPTGNPPTPNSPRFPRVP